MSDNAKNTGKFFIINTFIITSILISILGYIDYITGEISIDILYILCICAVRWHTNTLIGVLCSIEIASAKVAADYFNNFSIGSRLYEWNTFSNLCMYLVVCLLIGNLKNVLSK